MAITTHRTASERTPISPMRKTALIARIAYVATFVFSIPVKFGLWADVLDKPDFVLGAGGDSTVLWGALFEVLLAFACVATAVALYAVARRYSDRAALGFVTTRVLEAAMIFVGVLSILAIYTLRQDVAGTAGADNGALVTARHALVAIHDWTFLIGPGVLAAANALLIGSVMYRSRLLPRWIRDLQPRCKGKPRRVAFPSLTIDVHADGRGWGAIPAHTPRGQGDSPDCELSQGDDGGATLRLDMEDPALTMRVDRRVRPDEPEASRNGYGLTIHDDVEVSMEVHTPFALAVRGEFRCPDAPVGLVGKRPWRCRRPQCR